MEYIKHVIGLALFVVLYIGIIGVFMRIAALIGEQLGFGEFIVNLLKKKNKID